MRSVHAPNQPLTYTHPLLSLTHPSHTHTPHTHTPLSHTPLSHSHTEAAFFNSFGCPIHDLFAEFDPTPIASGSIGQIYKAVVGPRGAQYTGVKEGRTVAVKVCVGKEGGGVWGGACGGGRVGGGGQGEVWGLLSLLSTIILHTHCVSTCVPVTPTVCPLCILLCAYPLCILLCAYPLCILLCTCHNHNIHSPLYIQVRHPGVTLAIERDFALMMLAAHIAAQVCCIGVSDDGGWVMGVYECAMHVHSPTHHCSDSLSTHAIVYTHHCLHTPLSTHTIVYTHHCKQTPLPPLHNRPQNTPTAPHALPPPPRRKPATICCTTSRTS